MRFWVDPLPRPGAYEGTAIVVDVIRATTTAALYLRAGAKALVLAPGIEAARTLRQEGEVLAGEVGGLPPEGFDLGNSPREVDGVAGKTVVMATTNGTRAAHAAIGARHILLGSLQNAQAVAEVAAGSGGEVAIVCAGKEGNMALDDLYTAGVIGRRLQALGCTPLGEMAHLALFLAENRPLPVLTASEAAKALVAVGLGEDVAECARVDAHRVVPRFLGMRGEGMVFGL
ncbi:2-phosphosulfolactate phosphatase [Thermus caldifontis]|uniref:2-phosphosulfolactate phosphatase n=1 Tax=Thermus caldifontis TaxID=1930763 RepID=UPI000DF1B1B6|nr:2-phosphosulfolactate phosphatase [Thermus caldifontis]